MSRFHFVVGAVALGLFAAVWLWQSPFAGKLSPAELETYLAAVAEMPMPPEDKPEVLRRLRAFGAQDDGRPFYMVNLMRYREALRRYPGAPETDLTPEQANRYYEDSVMGMVLGVGAYPLAAGNVQAESVLPTASGADQWERMIVVRYPARRAFFDLLTDPDYAPYSPYKFMAMDIALVPAQAQVVWPEYRWLAGGVLLGAFLGLGWWRSARRSGL